MSTFQLDFQANNKQILAFQHLEDPITNEIGYGGGAGGGKSYLWVAWSKPHSPHILNSAKTTKSLKSFVVCIMRKTVW